MTLTADTALEVARTVEASKLQRLYDNLSDDVARTQLLSDYREAVRVTLLTEIRARMPRA